MRKLKWKRVTGFAISITGIEVALLMGIHLSSPAWCIGGVVIAVLGLFISTYDEL